MIQFSQSLLRVWKTGPKDTRIREIASFQEKQATVKKIHSTLNDQVFSVFFFYDFKQNQNVCALCKFKNVLFSLEILRNQKIQKEFDRSERS